MSNTDELSQLSELHRNGDLTDDEFMLAKRKLLGIPPSALSPIEEQRESSDEREEEAESLSTAEEEGDVPGSEDASEVYAKLLEDKSIASYSEKEQRRAWPFLRNKWVIGGAALLVIALIAHFGKHDSSNSSNIQSLDSGDKPSADSLTKPRLNFSYQITKESLGLVTVELSRKITSDEITVLANRLREAKSSYGNLSIVFLVKGLTDSGRTYAWARFDPDLRVGRLGSTEEEQKKAALIIKQNIKGKIIGMWHEDWRIASSDVFFEVNGKTFESRIFEGGIMEKSGSGPYPGENMELIKKKIRGSTRFYEKDGLDDYFVINKDGNLEFYDRDGGYITTGLKIQ